MSVNSIRPVSFCNTSGVQKKNNLTQKQVRYIGIASVTVGTLAAVSVFKKGGLIPAIIAVLGLGGALRCHNMYSKMQPKQ